MHALRENQDVAREYRSSLKVGTRDGTSPTNSNQFEFVGLVAGTKNGQFTRCDLSLRLVAGTSPIVSRT